MSWEYVSFIEAVDILDNLRKPINSKERASRIEGKPTDELYPYYGATGQVGYIDSYLSDGEYVLLGEDGAPFLNPLAKKAYIINGKAWVNNHAHILRSKTNNHFLCYYLNYIDYKGLVSGTTRLKLTQSQMKQIKIPGPPIQEQKRIVARIEELFSNLDSAVETLQKTKQQLEVYRQAVLREAFLPFSNKIPLKEIIECKLGKMLDKNKNKGIERQYIRNANVRWFGFDLNDLLLMRISDEEIERYSVIKGDLIICEGGEPGRCAIWNYEEPIFYQKALHRVRFVGKHNAKFYMYYFYYLAKCGQLKHYFTGSGIKRLTKDSLSKVTVPIAKKENQDNVVNEIEAKLSVCENIEKTVDEALQQAEAMRQSILKQAFEEE